MKQIIHSFLYGSTVWAACTVSQEVKAGGIPVSTTEDGDAVSPNIVCVVCEDIGPWLHCFGDSVAVTPTIDALAAEVYAIPAFMGQWVLVLLRVRHLLRECIPRISMPTICVRKGGRLHVHRR